MKASSTLHELTRRNVETVARMRREADERRTLGQRVADGVAATVGSWPFLIAQSVFFIVWVILNLVAWFSHWDPYPFILLNLVLSFQAAYASPIIMMSQNRQARLDERRHQLDLQINLLAEQENTEMLRLLVLLCEKSGINLDDNHLSKALEQSTDPEEVVRQIDGARQDQERKPAC